MYLLKLTTLLMVILTFSSLAVEKVTIGIAANFTAMSDSMWNPYANYFRDGVNLALSDFKGNLAKKGIAIELKQFDYGNEKVAARKVAIEAANSNAVAVIGFPYSSEVLLAGDIFNEHKLPFLSPSATADRIGTLGRYVRTCSFNDTFQGALLAQAAIKQSLKTTAILSIADCAFCQSLKKAFKLSFEGAGGKIILDESILESEAASPEVIKKIVDELKTRQIDAFFLPNYERVSATLIAALYDSGIRPKIWLGGDGWGTMSDLFLQIIGKRSIKGLALGHWHKDLSTQASQTFTNDFRKRFNKDPLDIAAVSYDAMQILLTAVLNAKTLSRIGVIDALENIHKFEGITSTIVYKKGERSPSKDAVLMQLKEGRVSLLKRVRQ